MRGFTWARSALFAALCSAFALSVAAQQPASAPAAANPLVAKTGPLEITSEFVYSINSHDDQTILGLRGVFEIKNTSSADIRLLLLGESLGATDDRGMKVWPQQANNYEYAITGLAACWEQTAQANKCFTNFKPAFVTISAGESTTLIVNNANGRYPTVNDRSGDFRKTHKPTNVNVTASVAIIDALDNEQIRNISFKAAPIKVISN